MSDQNVKPGRYRHFKGQNYIVHQQDYGDRRLWVRPKAMFMETVPYEGKEVPRFQYLGEVDE